MKIGKYIIIVFAFLIICCRVEKKLVTNFSFTSKELAEQEYYRNFTEGVKQEIIGNYKNAVVIYKDCIKRNPQNAAPYYQLSNIYLRAQDIDNAKFFGIRAASLNEKNFWYNLHIANIYQYESKYDSAVVWYEKVVALNNNPEYVYNLALLYSQCGKEKESLDLLKDLEKEFEGSKEIFLLKHNLYSNLKAYDSAVNELKHLTKNFPDEINNFGILAEYLNEIGRNAEAKEIYKYALEKDSSNGLILMSFGDFYLKKNEMDSAFFYYKSAFISKNLDNENKVNLVLNFLRDKEFTAENKDKIEELLSILRNKEDNFMLYALYADFYSESKNYEIAVQYMDSALTIKKDNYFLWEQSILISNYLNKYEEVIRKVNEMQVYFNDKENLVLIKAFAERSLSLNDSAIVTSEKIINSSQNKEIKVQAMNLLAEIYRDKLDHSNSDKYFEEILAVDNENLMIRNNYGYYLALRNEKLDRALELSELTVLRDPKNATYLDTYGWILFKIGKIKEARTYVEYAIRYGAYNNAEVLDHYGEIMLKLDKCKDTIEAWERIIEVDSTYNIVDKLQKIRENCK